jgi:hypothetical protein
MQKRSGEARAETRERKRECISGRLGSARVSRVGDDVSSSRTSFPKEKVRFGETPKPTRETRALPGPQLTRTHDHEGDSTEDRDRGEEKTKREGFAK